MDAMEALLTRRSCRTYQDRPIEPEVLDRIVEAGLYAPTGGGKQPWKLVVVEDRETRDRLSRMNDAVLTETAGARRRPVDPFYGAPVVIVVLTERERTTAVEDGALVIGNMLLAAHAQGVAGCWVHRAREMFDSDEGRELLAKWGVEGDYVGVGNCILGYADGPLPAPAPRRENTVVRVR